MDFLKHTDDPKFRGLVVRRINPQITGPGGIFETFLGLHREIYEDRLKVRKRDGVVSLLESERVKQRKRASVFSRFLVISRCN